MPGTPAAVAAVNQNNSSSISSSTVSWWVCCQLPRGTQMSTLVGFNEPTITSTTVAHSFIHCGNLTMRLISFSAGLSSTGNLQGRQRGVCQWGQKGLWGVGCERQQCGISNADIQCTAQTKRQEQVPTKQYRQIHPHATFNNPKPQKHTHTLTSSPCRRVIAAPCRPPLVTCAPQHGHIGGQQCTPVRGMMIVFLGGRG